MARNTEAEEIAGPCVEPRHQHSALLWPKYKKVKKKKKKNLSAGLPACLDCNKVSQGISL